MILDLQLSMQSVPITVRISIKERCTTLCDKVVSDLQQVNGFLRILRFPPPIYWLPWYNWSIVEIGFKHDQTNKQTNDFFYGWPNVKHMIKITSHISVYTTWYLYYLILFTLPLYLIFSWENPQCILILKCGFLKWRRLGKVLLVKCLKE